VFSRGGGEHPRVGAGGGEHKAGGDLNGGGADGGGTPGGLKHPRPGARRGRRGLIPRGVEQKKKHPVGRKKKSTSRVLSGQNPILNKKAKKKGELVV